MLLTPHTFVGIAIATSIPNPFISVPLAFVMHYFGDMVPHWDFFSHTKKEERTTGWRPMAVMADLAIGVAVGVSATLYALWVLNNQTLAINIFLCGIASVLPDFITGIELYTKKEPLLIKINNKIQHMVQFQAPIPWGILSQIMIISVSLLMIKSSLGL